MKTLSPVKSSISHIRQVASKPLMGEYVRGVMAPIQSLPQTSICHLRLGGLIVHKYLIFKDYVRVGG